jgi:hypothetical protein
MSRALKKQKVEAEVDVEPDDECIEFLTTHSYLKNFPPHNLLEDHKYKLPLSHFICYCVGIIDQRRVVQCIRILQKIPSDKITTMKVEWYGRKNNDGTWEKTQFWVNSGVCLKKQFFLFQDKLNFFRSTYIYYPEMQKYYRLSSFFYYMDVKECNPLGEQIYNSPMKSHTFKNAVVKCCEKIEERRKREIKKGLMTIMRRNIDNYLENQYPNLFREIVNILDK